jgi:hypothetical protein
LELAGLEANGLPAAAICSIWWSRKNYPHHNWIYLALMLVLKALIDLKLVLTLILVISINNFTLSST